MNGQHQKSYLLKPIAYKVNVFHIDTSYRYFHMSCNDCKLQKKCSDIKHKRKICSVEKQTDKLLLQFVNAKVSGFTGTEFYINYRGKENAENVKNILKFIRTKYIAKHNGK